jgi:chromosome partitioning protein
MGVSVIPASENLKNADADFNSRKRREYMLHDILETVTNEYDYIILDCQPNMFLLTENALVASDYYLVPLQAEYFAMEGLTQMLNGVSELKKLMRINVQLAGVFLTRYNPRKKLCRTVAETVRENLESKFFDTYIRENIVVSEAQAEGMPIFQYVLKNEIESTAAEDYVKLTDELLTKINHG